MKRIWLWHFGVYALFRLCALWLATEAGHTNMHQCNTVIKIHKSIIYFMSNSAITIIISIMLITNSAWVLAY